MLAGEFSSEELTSAHLERIKANNERLNSFISIFEESALSQAAEADKRFATDGENTPALNGIPISLKDALVTTEGETTCASKMLKGYRSPFDCTAYVRLKNDGCVLLGKNNLDEFTMGSSNEYSAYGPCKNAWDQSRVAGGTSGGSAVAVAAGQSALSLGSDTGGSVRQPAGFNGVFGLKPTYGRVSRYGLIAHASSLDQIGILGRSAEDVALALECIAGEDEMDSTCLKESVEPFAQVVGDSSDFSGIRIGVPQEYFLEGLNEEIAQSVRAAIATLEARGAQIVEVSLPHTEYALAAYYIIEFAEASSNLARYDGIRYGHRSADAETLELLYRKTRSEGFGPEVKRRIMLGSYVLSAGYYEAYYEKAQQVRTLLIDDFRAAFANHCDVIACPVSPSTAFELGACTKDPLAMYLADVYTVPVNLAGLPGLSVPCGVASDGLPIGLQLIGKPLAESTLLRLGSVVPDACEVSLTKHCGESQ